MNFVHPKRADIEFRINMDHVVSITREYGDEDGMVMAKIWFLTVEGTRLCWKYDNNEEGCDADYNLLLDFISSRGEGNHLIQ